MAVGMELSKNLNTDEAAAMGAVYKGADLSTGFKVKKFITKDAVVFPIQVVFERETNGETKLIKRMLFNLMNPYPQKKIITFNKHTDDFNFNVNYAELNHLNVDEVERLGSLNLSRFDVTGVKSALDKHLSDNVESKGIKAHFAMDESGILTLASVDVTFEKTTTGDEAKDESEESPLSKLGSTISKLFTSGNDPTPSPAENATESSETKPVNKTVNATESSNKTREEAPKPKIVTIKEPIRSEETVMILKQMSAEQLGASQDKLGSLNKVDRDRTRRETALNSLESMVIDAKSRLDTDEYAEVATAEEKEKIRSSCEQISEWLYEEGADADAATYEKRIQEFVKLTDDLYKRVWEHQERPEALKAMRQMLNSSSGFLASARNLTKTANPDKDVFTEVEIETLNKLIAETTQWVDKHVAEQKQLKKSEQLVLSVKMIAEKMAVLDREVKYLVNKLKIWRPKTAPVDKKEKKKSNATKKEDKEERVETEKEQDKSEQAERDEKAEEVKDQATPKPDDRNVAGDDETESPVVEEIDGDHWEL